MKNKFVIILMLVLSVSAQGQGSLSVMPHHLHYFDNFNRTRIVRVQNMAMNAITIDSIAYDQNVYTIRLNNYPEFPVNLPAGNQFTFEVVQSNYYFLTESDSSSIITIFNDSDDPTIEIGVHQHTFRWGQKGIISGTVSDSLGAIDSASIYFFYDQTLLIDSTKTDAAGNYTIEIPTGNYYVAAYREGYYMQFAYDKDSPLGADVVAVEHNQNTDVDFTLEEEIETELDLDGTITDLEAAALKKTIVVVRKGIHTPTKIESGAEDDVNRSYTTITNNNGFYKVNNVKYSGSYYVQAFAPLTIPGYYNSQKSPSVFWQDADSIDLKGTLNNIDIVLQRDSSYGAGVVEGSVLSNVSSQPVNDALVYVKSESNNKVYSYNLTSSEGRYRIPVLPYGTYRLIAQKIGVENSLSSPFEITTTQDTLTGIDLTLIVTSLEDENQPLSFRLEQNYPNPFNPSTNLEFSLNESSKVKLTIYNMLGEEVTTLLNDYLEKGNYHITFTAGNLSSGVYLYELQTNENKIVKKMNLIK